MRIQSAEFIVVGTELLSGSIDTNGPYVATQLARIGIEVTRLTVVGDSRASIRTALAEAFSRAPLVVLMGGLGPTGDDLTREVAAAYLKRPLRLDENVLESIRQAFAARGLRMPANNRVQAMVPRGARIMANPRGTAPGLWIEAGRRLVVLLPGPPAELKPMMEEYVLPWLGAGRSGGVRCHRILKVWGASESAVDERLRDLFNKTQPQLALLASQSEIKVKFTAHGATAEAAGRILDRAEREARRRLGRLVFGADADTMESVVGALLTRKGLTLAVAESCTGGLIGHKLTNVPGSSAYFDRGAVVYSNRAKQAWLGVPASLLARVGAVSDEVARAMARGIRKASRTDLGLAVTGIAGPTGATPAKPAGLVYVALDVKGRLFSERLYFKGSRDFVKERASQAALNLIRLHVK